LILVKFFSKSVNNLLVKTIIVFTLIFFSTQYSFASNLDEGIKLFSKQEYNKAVEFFLDSVKNNPEDPEPHKWLAKCYAELFMIELSLKETDKAKKLEEQNVINQRKKKNLETKKTAISEDDKSTIASITIDNLDKQKKYLGKKKIRIAVLNFKYKQTKQMDYPQENKFTQSITEYLNSNILNSGINMVQRDQIDEIIKEFKFENSEFVLSSTAKKIGKLYGIDYLLFGYVLDFSSEQKLKRTELDKKILRKECSIRLSTKLIKLETGEIVFSEVLSEKNMNTGNDFDIMSDFELEDYLMSHISKKISNKIVDKLNAKYSK